MKVISAESVDMEALLVLMIAAVFRQTSSAATPPNIEYSIHQCNGSNCYNGGVCTKNEEAQVWLCVCPPGYIDLHCLIKATSGACDLNPCANGGTCESVARGDSLDDFTCNCPKWFRGLTCELEMDTTMASEVMDPCNPNPCFNGGWCDTPDLDVEGSATVVTCKCPAGYEGPRCERDVKECELDAPCKNGGECQDFHGGYSCHCGAKFAGKNCQTQCFAPLGMEGQSILSFQITASSFLCTMLGLHKWFPSYARLNEQGLVNAWSPDDEDKSPWLQVDLAREMRVTGVITQGAKRMFVQEFVMMYTLAYSTNGKSWTFIKDPKTRKAKVFRGNNDNNTPVTTSLEEALIARYIRLWPKSCNTRCTLRMELLGCETNGCSEPLGMKDGHISDAQISASSTYRTFGFGFWTWEPQLGRLDQQGRINAWSADSADTYPWLQIDLMRPHMVTGVITQGAKDLGQVQFVRSFKVAHSKDGLRFEVYKNEATNQDKVFLGNSDNNAHKRNLFASHFVARYVRILPITWYNHITLRAELLGCSYSFDPRMQTV
uniref:EGF-like repeat and discoidin I-like domain-containing protein 3 isoform X2 n=1 Tax=Myxine glutinosa TaxID=7769 RepID=UPI00358F3622